MMDVPLQVDADAFGMLPKNVQDFLQSLNHEAVVTNGFLWDNVICIRNKNGSPCVQLCAFGSPSRDRNFIWSYNTETCNYEMYCTPYGTAPTLAKCTMGADAFGPVLETPTFSMFIEHVLSDDVAHMDLCADRFGLSL
jgi:hypothetical protein